MDFVRRAEHRVERARICEVEKLGIRMEPLEGRVLVVAVESDVSNLMVFEVLDEVDGEEAFADSAFAIEDEVEAFVHVSLWLRSSTWAIRGSRDLAAAAF